MQHNFRLDTVGRNYNVGIRLWLSGYKSFKSLVTVGNIIKYTGCWY